ncbi:unnamed protein product [Urochloa humidicola]
MSCPPPARSASTTKTPPGAGGDGEYKTYIILLWPPSGPDAIAMDAAAHRTWHESFLPTRLTDAGEPRLLRSYRFVFNGFAASLTDAKLKMVEKKPGFLRSFPERVRHLLTTRSPGFLGLTQKAGVWWNTGYGKGTIIGVVDTGVHPSHPSLHDRGINTPPPKWKGSCQGSIRCNNKLIGAKTFVDGDSDATDHDGHGTHTATAAAGNFVEDVSFNGLAPGTAAGTAPGAHLAVYKACDYFHCNDTTVLHAMDAAIDDGVDVLSISLGMDLNRTSFDHDPIAIGAFTAVSRGVLVVAAAGNDGPGASTLHNDAPWMLTVAAGSIDRLIPADVQLEDGDLVLGESLGKRTSSSTSKGWAPIIYSKNQQYCDYPEAETSINGKVVVCDAGYNPAYQYDIIERALDSGAEGVVLIDRPENGYTTVLDDYGPEVIQVPDPQAANIRKYAASPGSAGIVSLINDTKTDFRPAPVVAHFSSRGPSLRAPGVLKPDILAPGLNILSGSTPVVTGITDDGRAFRFMSGTSIAAPQVSGVAALVKHMHPGWSAAAIKSAILTTADTVGNDGGPIMDHHRKTASAYAAGAGHVNATRAVDPGLIYDLGASDYASYLCSLLRPCLRAVSRNSSWSCQDLLNKPETMLDFNYPSITVPLQETPITVVRTLTNVAVGVYPAETYKVSVEMPVGVVATVEPYMLSFFDTGDKASFTVTVSQELAPGGQVIFEGSLTWVSARHRVRTPIVAVVGLGGAPSSTQEP